MTFKQFITEGTSATITVYDGSTYRTSILQYDASTAGDVLTKKYNNSGKAKKLVTKSGDLGSIDPLDFYDGRILLRITKDEKKALDNANESHIKFYFSGEDWYEARGHVQDFGKMKKI